MEEGASHPDPVLTTRSWSNYDFFFLLLDRFLPTSKWYSRRNFLSLSQTTSTFMSYSFENEKVIVHYIQCRWGVEIRHAVMLSFFRFPNDADRFIFVDVNKTHPIDDAIK